MKKILCFGDSNTWGHNPTDCSRLEKRWTVMIDEMLTDCEIVQDSVCGRSTKFDVPDTPSSNGIEVFREKYLSGENEFDLIIIMLGTNDQLNYFDCSAEETAEALRGYVKECRGRFGASKPEILLISPIHISDSALHHPIFKDLYSKKSVIESNCFAEKISAVAKQEQVHFLDASKYASPSEIDGVHMDFEEHKKLANAVAARIQSILF